MTTSATFDPGAIVKALCSSGVRFVVIGGYAAGLQGVEWMTLDLDIVIDDNAANFAALADALLELDAWCLVAPGSIQRIRPDLERIQSLTGTLMLRTRHGRLDVMKGTDSGSGGDNFSALTRDAMETSFGDMRFLVASLPALLRMKAQRIGPRTRASSPCSRPRSSERLEPKP